MYKKVDASLNFLQREQEVLDFWNANNVFEQSIKNNEGHEEFTFYDGPPTANGKPHIGHVLTRVMKDIIPRYQTMKGKHVLRKAGWDTHGLPVELEIEKKLGLDGKQDIEKYGIEPFIKECKQSVWKYTDEWKKMSDRLGYWVDMEHPYVTYDDNYIESVWWALKTIAEKGLLYKGYKIVPYCPRCGTALSSHEVAQGYKDVKEKSVYVKFKIKGKDNAYFLVWTTTPWTLPSNVALCMNAEYDYVEIKVGDETYVLAEALVPTLFEDYEVISRKKGKDYEYTEYEPMFPYALGTFKEKAFYVVNDPYVTLTDGTGIVHIAPAFGEDDSLVGKKYKLPFVQMVNDRGRFIDAVEPYKGMFVKDADKLIIKDLKESGVLFKDVLFEHSYPFCWRCNTPLLYYARSSWFIKTTAIKEQLIASNKSVNWMPETIGTGRMGNFLENVIDWGLSRERYWGTPLPVWVCEDCGEIHVMGSKKELKEMCGIEGDIELHRPYIDVPTCKCPKCGGKMKRVKEVIDCWFDSGSMPFAQFHYPFENKELFEKTVHLINDFKDYFIKNGQEIYENPSPGNKDGGITTLEDKSLGCTQKSGSSLVKGVLAYGERVSDKGLNLLSAPGNDLVASTACAAAGAQMVLFTTGRGTPFASPVPTVKIATNSRLAGNKSNWIDFNAGRIVTDDLPLEDAAKELFQLVLDVASGKKVKAEIAGFHDLAIFKQGVTL